MQVQLPSGNEDLEFRVYGHTLLSTFLTGNRVPEGHGGLVADNLASVRLANKSWKERLSKLFGVDHDQGPLDATSRALQSEVLRSILAFSIYLESAILLDISQALCQGSIEVGARTHGNLPSAPPPAVVQEVPKAAGLADATPTMPSPHLPQPCQPKASQASFTTCTK